MLSRFTKQAIEIIEYAQKLAKELKHNVVYSEHILLAITKSTKGLGAKILRVSGVDFDELEMEILRKLREKSYFEEMENVPFTKSAKNIIKMAIKIADEHKNKLVMPEHLMLAVLNTQNFGSYKILNEYDFDKEKVVQNLMNLL